MAKVFLIAATNERDRNANSLNAALVVAADADAARAAAIAAAPNGEIDAAKVNRWSGHLIADGTITLPAAATVQWLGAAYGNVNPLPGQ